MAPGEPRLESLSIYLFEDDTDDLEECLDSEKLDELVELPIQPDIDFNAKAYYKPPTPSPPRWLSFLEDALDGDPDFQNQTVSAVLVLESDGRFFGVPWGYAGRHFLAKKRTVEDFGLKTALNCIDPQRVRSTDSQEIDETSKHRREQASQAVKFDEFDFDASRAILRSVTGQPNDEDIGKRLTGKGHVRLQAELTIDDLDSKCEQLLGLYHDDAYKENFSWLDSLRTVKDPDRVQELDSHLVEKMQGRETESAHLAPPDIVNWTDIEWFLYPKKHNKEMNRVDEPDLDGCLDAIEGSNGFDLSDLKSKEPRVKLTHTTKPQKPWSIYEMLVFECELDGSNYVLSRGKWFEVDSELVDEIDSEVDALQRSDLGLPEAHQNEAEEEYNERASQASDDRILMDRQLCKPERAASPIEVCDILTTDQDFVHIKKRGYSQTLSYLFSQGAVSAQTFIQDTSFREQAREKAENRAPDAARRIPWDDPQMDDMDVVYGVIGDDSKIEPTSLPFFAKVNLTHNLRTLGPMQCGVEYALIPYA